MNDNFQDTSRIRKGALRDITQILNLNRHWLAIGNDSNSNKAYGCLAGEPYTHDQIAHFVQEELLVVSAVGEQVAAYYFLDDGCNNPQTVENMRIVDQLRISGVVTGSCICPRAQVAVHPNFLFRGLYKPMSDLLISHAKRRYDGVFSTVGKGNKQGRAHLQLGWKVVGGDENSDFIYLSLKDLDTPNAI